MSVVEHRPRHPSREPSELEKQDVLHQEVPAAAIEDDTDPAEAKKIIRKVDWHVLPLMIFLYMITFLDRVNLGNARLWNMEKDMNMTGYDYNIAVLVFYIPYIILEIPSQMLFQRMQPRKFIAMIIMGWGLSITFSGFCNNSASFIVCRVLLGVFEAGMFPALAFLISEWYRRHELMSRMAIFFVSNDIAGTISGLLGAGLGSLQGTAGLSGWRWIMFIEGAMTCVTAVVAWFFVVPFPEESTFLKPEEKAWYLRRLQGDKGAQEKRAHITFRNALSGLKDWKVWTAGILYLACTTTAYSISVFQPTILATFGWDSMKANLLSAPPRIASGIVSVTAGFLSDKFQRRGVFCLFGFALSSLGLFLVAFLHGTPRYVGIYLAACGTYIVQPLTIAWCCNQVTSSHKRGIITAFAGMIGQIGGIISSVVYPKKDGPQYVPGNMTCFALQVVGAIAAINMWLCANYENKARAAGKRDHLRQLPEEEQRNLGEKHPDFRYTP